MEWITQHILEVLGLLGLVGTFIVTIFWIGEKSRDIIKSIEHLEKSIDKLENSLNARIDRLENSLLSTRIGRLENIYDSFVIEKVRKNVSPTILVTKSPIQLTLYAQELLHSIEFEIFFETIKNELISRLDKLKLQTRYDVQEKSRELLVDMKDEKMLIPLKTKAYDKGKDYNDILLAVSIPLRDYYLSIHPEIKD